MRDPRLHDDHPWDGVPEHPPFDPDVDLPRAAESGIDKIDMAILKVLNTGLTMDRYEVEAHVPRGSRSVGRRLGKLVTVGMVRHLGQRGGYTITEFGRNQLRRYEEIAGPIKPRPPT
jgi:hypothetical protein